MEGEFWHAGSYLVIRKVAAARSSAATVICKDNMADGTDTPPIRWLFGRSEQRRRAFRYWVRDTAKTSSIRWTVGGVAPRGHGPRRITNSSGPEIAQSVPRHRISGPLRGRKSPRHPHSVRGAYRCMAEHNAQQPQQTRDELRRVVSFSVAAEIAKLDQLKRKDHANPIPMPSRTDK
jgi:hypothetical protein